MKSLRLYIIIAAALLTVYIIALYNQPKPIDWTETLSNTDKIPFGTYILYDRLHDIFPRATIKTYREPVYNVLNDHDIKNATYLIICDNINLNEYDYTKLKQYIKNGNDVFIAATYFGDQFKKDLKIETRAELGDTGIVKIKLNNKYLDTNKTYGVKRGMSDVYFSRSDTTGAYVLGSNLHNDHNFIKYSLGKGNLYLNTMPLMFTNYSLLNNDGADYAAKALSYVKNSPQLIWDQYYTLGREDEGSSMRVFLRHPPLKWAFYIGFFSMVVFVLFGIKRRQRIIPVIEPLQNTTLDFVNVVGQVYYEQRDNSNIAQKKAAYFLEHLRTQYNLKTNVLNNEFVEMLAHKSGVDTELIQQLLQQVTLARSGVPVSDAELIDLNQNIERFYKRSK